MTRQIVCLYFAQTQTFYWPMLRRLRKMALYAVRDKTISDGSFHVNKVNFRYSS